MLMINNKYIKTKDVWSFTTITTNDEGKHTSSHLMNFSPSCKAFGTSIGFRVTLEDLELEFIVNNKHNQTEIISQSRIKSVIF